MSAISESESLKHIELFAGLSAEQFAELASHLKKRTFPTGTSIVMAEQPGEVVYVISSGCVKVTAEQSDGREVILAVLSEGEIIGEMSLSEAEGRSATCIAIEESCLWWLPRKTFQIYLVRFPVLAGNLVSLLSQRLRLANEQIQALATKDVEGRIARQLVALSSAHGKKQSGGEVLLPFRLTQSDLAAMTGATRERVNQVMASYKQRRYLSVDKNHHITINNLNALLARLGSN